MRHSNSIRKRIRVEVRQIMRNRTEMSLYQLKDELTLRLGTPIRLDLMVSNLLGLQGFAIDCESQTLMKV